MKTASTLMALTLATAACGSDAPAVRGSGGTPVDVVVTSPFEAPEALDFAAEITAERSADLATRLSGSVRTVHVDLGSRVRAGAPLVSLDARDVEARVEAARAALVLAEKDHGRLERLAAAGAASAQEVERSQAGLEAARSSFEEAASQQGYAVVRAPFDGVITARFVNPGDMAVPGAPLLTLVDPTDVRVTVDLPAGLVASVREGTQVQVRVVGVDESVPARVTRMVPAVTATGRTFRIEATPDRPLRGAVPGAYARLSLAPPGDGIRWIPADAVVERGQLRGVFLVEDGVARLRWVRLGAHRGDAIELLSGPGGVLQVVRAPGPGVLDGVAVASARSEPWTPSGTAVPEVVR